MKKICQIFFALCLILLLEQKSKAQNYNINILASRVIYNSKKNPFSDKKYGIEFYFLGKYAEIERKFSSKYSINLGMSYSVSKFAFEPTGTIKSSSLDINPSLRYYTNKKANMNGFYIASGFNYFNYQSTSKDYLEENKNVITNNYKSNALNADFFMGYKLVIIHNRFSIDLKLQQQLNLLWTKNRRITYDDNTQTIQKTTSYFNSPDLPYLDLKLGYRFGFKK